MIFDVASAVRYARRERNEALIEHRTAVDPVGRWCATCAAFFDPGHDDHDDETCPADALAAAVQGRPACPCLVCEVVGTHARARGLAEQARTSLHGPAGDRWRTEPREVVEDALGRPLGPRERVRRLADGRILPTQSWTISGPLLDRIEQAARRLGLDREGTLNAVLSAAEGRFD